jgi:hypothetical protein
MFVLEMLKSVYDHQSEHMMCKVGSFSNHVWNYIYIFLTTAAATGRAAAAARKTNRVRAPPDNIAAGLANTANRAETTVNTTLECATEGAKERHCSNRVA